MGMAWFVAIKLRLVELSGLALMIAGCMFGIALTYLGKHGAWPVHSLFPIFAALGALLTMLLGFVMHMMGYEKRKQAS